MISSNCVSYQVAVSVGRSEATMNHLCQEKSSYSDHKCSVFLSMYIPLTFDCNNLGCGSKNVKCSKQKSLKSFFPTTLGPEWLTKIIKNLFLYLEIKSFQALTIIATPNQKVTYEIS